MTWPCSCCHYIFPHDNCDIRLFTYLKMVRARPRTSRNETVAGPPESCAEKMWFLQRTGFCRVRWRSLR